MGKQVGLIKITGTFDELSFYEMGGRHYVRRKGGPTRKQVLKSPNFENSRRLIAEFAKCSRDAGLLRRSIRYIFKLETPYHRRLNKVMLKIKSLDLTSLYGERCIHNGLKTSEGRASLLQFDFIKGSELNRGLANRISIARNRTLRIKDFSPLLVNFPKGAQLVLITAGIASLDFKSEKSQVSCYQSILIDRKSKMKEISLSPLKTISSLGDDFYFLHLQFFTRSGKEYTHCNKKQHDILSLIALNPIMEPVAVRKEKQKQTPPLTLKPKSVSIVLGLPTEIENLAPA